MEISLGASPATFAESIAQLKTLVLAGFDREVLEKGLCYHNRSHIEAVQRRTSQLFQVVRPELTELTELNDAGDRLALLLDFCAVAHDAVQIFLPLTDPHGTRRREAGVSETATIEQLFQRIQTFNGQVAHPQARITEDDCQIIREAIEATICAYDPQEQAIYQPSLYDRDRVISPVTRILAIADIGSLVMEGVESYNEEGRLIFLEENPDVYHFIATHQLKELAIRQPDLAENIRQRLLRRSQFQVSFARSRIKRSAQELEGLPTSAIPILLEQLFPYLTAATLEEIESITPTDSDTSFSTLINFFQLA
ncbi:MAG TPA: hypothetical protein V6D46_01425 [Coleofasciculaceae cyanobacterium]